MTTPSPTSRIDGQGLAAATTAFLMWGLLPIYFKQLPDVSTLQVTAHRLLWGCVVAFVWLGVRREVTQVRTALMSPAICLRLLITAALISANWITYIWAIANDHIIDASLGYFINPLVNVVLGVMALRERLNTMQWTSVAIATLGVAYLTWSAGQLPWIGLILALAFGLYGLVRKTAHVDALPGFAGETLLLVPIGLGYLLWCESAGIGTFAHSGLRIDLLLILGGPLTAVPLVLFAVGARRIPLSTVGLLQYMAPTIQLLIGVFVYGEPFDSARAVGFALIWAALAIYAADGVWRSRKTAAIAG
jgi:chloramphenicol-sensitive protein RarD